MKKLLMIAALAFSFCSYAQKPADSEAVSRNGCDAVDIPVFIVDGVEVQDISGIASDDIVKVDIIKDPAIVRIFSPREGGVVLITTKSKKFLTPILKEYEKMTEEQRKQRIPGELRIR